MILTPLQKLPKNVGDLGNFCKDVKIVNSSSEIIFGQLFIDIWLLFTGHTGCHESASTYTVECIMCALNTFIPL